MRLRTTLRRTLRRLRRGEDGIAIPTVLAMVGISSAFVAISITASMSAQSGTIRDSRSKRALAAADAGLGVALLRQNRYQTSPTSPCIYVSGGTLTTGSAAGDGWCPAVSGTVGGVDYSYRVTPGSGATPVTLVSTGTDSGVIRRTAVSASPLSGATMLAEEGVFGQDLLSLGGNPDIQVSAGTNGDVALQGTASICGNIRHGIGKTATFTGSADQCDGYSVIEGNRLLPPLILPTGIETSPPNSNRRLSACTAPNTPSTECGKDTYSKNRSSTVPWDAATRTINVGSGATLTMGGGDYFICQFNMNNGDLIMPAGAHVRIYFDTPENCGISAGGSQISMGGNSHIQSTGFDPSHGVFDLPGFYVQGSKNIPTTVTMGGNAGSNEFILYAPYSDVTFQGDSTLYGLLAGKTLSMGGNPTIAAIPGLPAQNFSTTSTYRRDRYVECTAVVASPPDAGC
jgi:hypothetical protein